MRTQLTLGFIALIASGLTASCDDSTSNSPTGMGGQTGPGGTTGAGGSSAGSNSGGSTSGGSGGGELTTGMGGTSAGMGGLTIGVGGSSGGTANDSCTIACQKLFDANCSASTGTVAECAADCSQPGVCDAEWEPYLACLAFGATITCDVSGAAISNGCDATVRPYQECLICAPFDGETACDVCLYTDCCAEQQEFALAPDANDFLECFDICVALNDLACVDACVSDHRIAGAAYGDAVECLDTNCLAECG